jgi:AraC family transcriptional regulator, transcriptional activator of pobA
MATGRARRAPEGAIPTVDFYGDATEWSTSALLHSEPLIERSRQHAWNIRPHRHLSLAQVFWLARGHGRSRFDAESYRLSAPCVAVIPERCVHEFEWDQDSDGFALSIASALVQDLHRQLGATGDALSAPAVLAAREDAGYVNTLFEAIHAEYASERALKEILLDGLIKALTVWIVRAAAPTHRAIEHKSRGSRHYERFTKLLEVHHGAQWTVAAYASEIGITPPHLNAICKQVGGTPALSVIHDRLLLAARRALSYTDKSIADVATSLGFSEPSYFARFFKRKMQMTPKQYRRGTGTVPG